MKQRKNYIVQHHEKECASCRNFDSIKESIFFGERGKTKILICMLDHLEVEKAGLCDNYTNR